MNDSDWPWFTVTSPAEVMDYCGACGARIRAGDQVRRIHGGYGYQGRCCAAGGTS